MVRVNDVWVNLRQVAVAEVRSRTRGGTHSSHTDEQYVLLHLPYRGEDGNPKVVEVTGYAAVRRTVGLLDRLATITERKLDRAA